MTCQPIMYRPQYGAYGANMRATCVTFVTQAAIDAGLERRIHGRARLTPVKGTRTLGKAHMVRNHLCPEIAVDPETYTVRVNGEHVTCRPARVLPLAQRYFLR
jgi:urease subunit alpha